MDEDVGIKSGLWLADGVPNEALTVGVPSVVICSGPETSFRSWHKTGPSAADIRVDGRQFPNPHNRDAYRHRDGLEPEVAGWLLSQKSPKHHGVEVRQVLHMTWLSRVHPAIQQALRLTPEGRLLPTSELQGTTSTIQPPFLMVVTCFGGHHRSPVIGHWFFRRVSASWPRLRVQYRRVPYQDKNLGQYPEVDQWSSVPLLMEAVPDTTTTPIESAERWPLGDP